MGGKREVPYIGSETSTKSLRSWELVLFNLQHSRLILLILILLYAVTRMFVFVCVFISVCLCLCFFVGISCFSWCMYGNGVCIVCMQFYSENRVRVNVGE